MNDSEKLTIFIGNAIHTLDADNLPPYVKAFVAFEKAKRCDQAATIFTHNGDIPLFDVAIVGLQHGYRHIFRRLGCDDLAPYRTICETYNFLGVDIIDETETLDEIITKLKAGRAREDETGRSSTWHPGEGNKSKSRDAAFQLLYLILLVELSEATDDDKKIYNAVFFIVSHPTIFKRATRDTVRKAYDSRFFASKRETATLDRWAHPHRSDENADATTSEDENDQWDVDEWDSDY